MDALNGLLPPALTHSAVTNSYYLTKDAPVIDEPTLIAPTLISPVALLSADSAASASMTVTGLSGGAPAPYTGAVTINTGGSSAGPSAVAITSRAGANGAIVEIGANAQASNLLLIAGASGTGQVYDEVYNQPVALQAITMVSQTPLCVRDPANTSEIFRCAQAAVAAADAGAGQTNRFTVPKSGFYALQMEVNLFNAPAPAAPTVNVPAVVAGGIDVYGALGFTLSNGVVVIPYGSHEMVGGELFSSDCLLANSGVNKIHCGMYLLAAGTTYSFTMAANRPAGSTAWNIGDAGAIKAELIAMC